MRLKDKRIFIFEDDAYNLAVLSVPLRREGASVLFDRWGDTSSERLAGALPIDLILLDLMYPNGITGYQIFERIRLIEALKTVPIIAVTAADPDIEMPRAREKGFNGFIGKPITKRFIQYVLDALNGKEIWETD
jgi:CheY-like chemotaxis protein